MAKILVYNNDSNSMETYYRDTSQAMPYISNSTLTVDEFMLDMHLSVHGKADMEISHMTVRRQLIHKNLLEDKEFVG